jgi:pimeloyl-ACP methyl ester carboxylesterase
MRSAIDELSRWHKPTLVVFSDTDSKIPYPAAGQMFCDLTPSAVTQVRIESAEDFVPEDHDGLLAHEVTKLLGSYDRRPG